VTFARITALCWSGRTIYVGDSSGKVVILSFDAEKSTMKLLRYGVYKSRVSGLTHSSKYNLLVVNTANNHMHVVDGTSLSLIRVFTRPNDQGDIRSCFLDDQTVVSGSDDGSIYVFDVKTGQLVTVGEGGHRVPVPAVDCSSDRRLLCTVTSSEMCIWESQELL
jgi:WD40 repeat protein